MKTLQTVTIGAHRRTSKTKGILGYNGEAKVTQIALGFTHVQ